MAKSFEYYFAQLRKTEEHRSKEAEVAIRKLYKELLQDTKHFLAEEYYQLAEDGKLTFEILFGKGQNTRFLEEVEQRLNGLSPKVSQEIQQVVEEMYTIAYDGMVKAVVSSQTSEELKAALTGLQGVSPETIKATVENPIAGLTLKDTLEKNRKNIIWDIKRQIGVGLTNGDRYDTMARRVAKSLDGDYKKAVTIVRTEAGRVREAGHLASAKNINETLKNGTTSMRLVKTWKTMKDGRVRDHHHTMDGVTVAMDEDFVLPGGVKTQAPKQSGVASEDINCRCFVKYHLEEATETADTAENQIGKLEAEYEEIAAKQKELMSKAMATGDFGVLQTEEAFSLNSRAQEIKAKIERYETERTNAEIKKGGHLTKEEFIEALPDEWRSKWDYDREATYGDSISAVLSSWTGEGYEEMKENYLLESAIANSTKKWSGKELYRGISVPEETLDALQEGTIFKQDGLASWSTDINAAMEFAYTNKNPILIIDKTSGTRDAVSIKAFSGRMWENEVLYSGKAEFEVLKVVKQDVAYKKRRSNAYVEDSMREVTIIEVKQRK